MQRRTFLRRMALGIAPAFVPRWLLRRFGWPAGFELSAPEKEQMRVLAEVVLPETLGRGKIDSVAEEFAKWIREYKAGADLGCGYGITRPRKAPANPAMGYAKQLRALEEAARAEGNTFAGLGRSGQRILVAAALEQEKIEVVPRRPNGRHVVADLMSFYFYVDPDGEDYLYQAAVEREGCRGLPSSRQRPAALK